MIVTAKFDELPDAERQTVLRKRAALAERDGVELTPEQFVDVLGQATAKIIDGTGCDLDDFWRFAQREMIPDPNSDTGVYDGYFDDAGEAQEFVDRAARMNKQLKVIPSGRYWKVGIA